MNTGERLTDAYVVNGRYQPDALQAINHILRDHRTDAVYPIDPTTLDILSTLQSTLDARTPFHIVHLKNRQDVLEGQRRPPFPVLIAFVSRSATVRLRTKHSTSG